MIPSSTNPESERHASVQVLLMGIMNYADAEQVWWYIRDGIFKNTGISIILLYEIRNYITSECLCISYLCRIIVSKNRLVLWMFVPSQVKGDALT